MSEIEKERTPRFEVNLKKLMKNFINFQDSFSKNGLNCTIAYAVKANYDYQIIKSLFSLGSHFELSSPDEIFVLDSLNVPRKNIVVNGCFSNHDFINGCIKSGCLFFLDAMSQIEYLEDGVEIGIRVNYDCYKKDNSRYYVKSSRFGIPIENFRECLEKLAKKKIQVRALNMHTSGNDRSPSTYNLAISIVNELKQTFQLNFLKQIDLGGGYKIDERFWSVDDYSNEIKKTLQAYSLEKYEILVEPGNSIVRTCCSYITKIIAEKNRDGKRILIADGSCLHLGIPNPYKAKKMESSLNAESNLLIVGSSCKESDVFEKETKGNELHVGDMLIYENVGAYTIDNNSGYIVPKAFVNYIM
jgi:diaminopimelate decarboxylase